MAGIGEFYGGMLHPLFVLSHLLVLLVCGLLIGQRGVRAMQLAYPSFIVCLTVGLFLAGFEVQPALAFEPTLLAIAMIGGVVVAAQRPPAGRFLALLAGGVGLLVGMDSGVAGLERRETFAALLGCWLGAVVLLIVIAGVCEMAHRYWQRIAVRVLGSWVAASGSLVLALALSPVS